ncbi:MAG: hypothetical protein ACI8RO_000165, partial [Flavobacteriales bacterium]
KTPTTALMDVVSLIASLSSPDECHCYNIQNNTH